METLRIVSRRTVQQLLHARPFQTKPPVFTQPSYTVRNAFTSSKPRIRSLYVPFRFSAARSQRLPGRTREVIRGFATATETSTQHVGLSQRLKNLSREYGWTALGVYLLLSALDFPFCFLAVRWLGTDRIGHWEHVVVSTIKEWIKWPFSSNTQDRIDGVVHEVKAAAKEKIPMPETGGSGAKRILDEDDTYVSIDHGYKEAQEATKGANASLWTQLALAYAIHKSFIFIRVPLTAAILPKVVKTLRSWGWKIGKRPAKAISAQTSSRTAGVNAKGSGVTKE